MSVFVVLSKTPNRTLEQRIASIFSGEHHRLAETQWLVRAPLTTKQLCEKLNITNSPEMHSVVVFSINNYYGKHSPEVWEWLKVSMEKE